MRTGVTKRTNTHTATNHAYTQCTHMHTEHTPSPLHTHAPHRAPTPLAGDASCEGAGAHTPTRPPPDTHARMPARTNQKPAPTSPPKGDACGGGAWEHEDWGHTYAHTHKHAHTMLPPPTPTPQVMPVVKELGRTRMEANVAVKSLFGPKMFALNVVVLVPVPDNTAKANILVTSGKAKYDATKKAIVSGEEGVCLGVSLQLSFKYGWLRKSIFYDNGSILRHQTPCACTRACTHTFAPAHTPCPLHATLNSLY